MNAATSTAHVDRETDQPLLGRDRDRQSVRGGHGLLLVPLALAPERAPKGTRSVTDQRPVGEQLHATLDQVRAAARDLVQAGVAAEIDLQRALEGEHEDRGGGQPDGGGRGGAPHVPPQGGEHDQARQQGREARLREGQHESRPQDGKHRPQAERHPRLPAPQHPRRGAQHHEHEETPVDIRVPEDGVDAEVGLELVRRDHLRVPQELAALVLPEADRDEHQRQHDGDCQATQDQLAAPSDLGQEAEQHRERDQEEDDLLERRVEVLRVEALQRVHDHVGGQGPLECRRLRGGRFGATSEKPAPHERRAACRDHDVERHEEVGGAARGLDGDPERERRNDQRGKRVRPADEDRRQPDHDSHATHDQQRHLGGVVADRLELLGVRDVLDQDHGRECKRAGHPRDPAAAVGIHERSCRDQRGDHDSGLGDALDYRESRVHSLRIIRVASGDVASDDAKPRAPTRATTPSGTR